MYQTYMPQYQQRQEYAPQMMQQSGGWTIRPVASRAEAEVSQIPFDGSTHCFFDTSTGKMYAKTFNPQNGSAPLVTFVREAEPAAPEYATMDIIKDIKASINRLAKEIEMLKKGDPEDE